MPRYCLDGNAERPLEHRTQSAVFGLRAGQTTASTVPSEEGALQCCCADMLRGNHAVTRPIRLLAYVPPVLIPHSHVLLFSLPHPYHPMFRTSYQPTCPTPHAPSRSLISLATAGFRVRLSPSRMTAFTSFSSGPPGALPAARRSLA